jgi:hypothetical protein
MHDAAVRPFSTSNKAELWLLKDPENLDNEVGVVRNAYILVSL